MTQRVIIFKGSIDDPLPVTVNDPLPVIHPGPVDVNIVGGSVTIPPGLATDATLATRLSEATFVARSSVPGQALMAASSPVVIASNQSAIPVSFGGGIAATQSGPWTVGVNNFPATQAVSGTVAVSNFPATQPISGTVGATQSGTWTAAQSGTWTVGVSGTVPVSAVSLPLPAGAATEATLATRSSAATQALIKAKTDNLDVLLSTISSAATQNLIKAKTDNLDVALSTRLAEATFTTRTPVVGQAAMSASSPVVIASNQSSIPTNKAASYLHLNVAGTTVIKASPGVLHKITINDFGGGTITFYDNTAGSGTVIAAIKPAGNTGTLLYELSFTIGLTAVIVGASPGDITVTYD